MDLLAEFRLDLSRLLSVLHHALGAAIAAIPFAPGVIVVIVADAVSLVVSLRATGRLRVTFLVVRVQAFALQTKVNSCHTRQF